jgi:ribonuclease HI
LSTAELDKKPHKHLLFEIRKLAKKFVLHAVWVKSHNGCSENNEVDEMASEKLQDYFEKLEIEKDKNYLAEFEAQQNGLSTN